MAVCSKNNRSNTDTSLSNSCEGAIMTDPAVQTKGYIEFRSLTPEDLERVIPPPPEPRDDAPFSAPEKSPTSDNSGLGIFSIIGLMVTFIAIGVSLTFLDTSSLLTDVKTSQQYLVAIAYAGENPAPQAKKMESNKMIPSVIEPAKLLASMPRTIQTKEEVEVMNFSEEEVGKIQLKKEVKKLSCKNWNPKKHVSMLYFDKKTRQRVIRCSNGKLYLYGKKMPPYTYQSR